MAIAGGPDDAIGVFVPIARRSVVPQSLMDMMQMMMMVMVRVVMVVMVMMQMMMVML